MIGWIRRWWADRQASVPARPEPTETVSPSPTFREVEESHPQKRPAAKRVRKATATTEAATKKRTTKKKVED